MRQPAYSSLTRYLWRKSNNPFPITPLHAHLIVWQRVCPSDWPHSFIHVGRTDGGEERLTKIAEEQLLYAALAL